MNVSEHGVVDVIIPAFNAEFFIEKAIKSVLAQTFDSDKIRITVVNDGSTDGTATKVLGLMSKLTADKLKFIDRLENKGANYSRNEGLRATGGEYVFIMDADALLSPTLVEDLVKTLEGTGNVNVGYAYCSFTRIWVTSDGSRRLDVWSPAKFDEAKLKQNNYISMMSLIKRKVLPQDPMDEHIKRFQDWDLWLALCLDYGVIGVLCDKVLFTAYILEDGISGDMSSMQESANIVRCKHNV